jgi:uncharacterized protein DUF4242
LPQYLVERFLPGDPETELAAVGDRAGGFAEEMRSEGVPVRYFGSTMVPEDQICFCLFEGPSAEAVREVNMRAGLTFERILEALWTGSRGKEES